METLEFQSEARQLGRVLRDRSDFIDFAQGHCDEGSIVDDRRFRGPAGDPMQHAIVTRARQSPRGRIGKALHLLAQKLSADRVRDALVDGEQLLHDRPESACQRREEPRDDAKLSLDVR